MSPKTKWWFLVMIASELKKMVANWAIHEKNNHYHFRLKRKLKCIFHRKFRKEFRSHPKGKEDKYFNALKILTLINLRTANHKKKTSCTLLIKFLKLIPIHRINPKLHINPTSSPKIKRKYFKRIPKNNSQIQIKSFLKLHLIRHPTKENLKVQIYRTIDSHASKTEKVMNSPLMILKKFYQLKFSKKVKKNKPKYQNTSNLSWKSHRNNKREKKNNRNKKKNKKKKMRIKLSCIRK